MIVYTGQLNRRAEGAGVDITVKSASGMARLVAPTWPMVMGYKRNTLTAEEYTAQYLDILESRRAEILEWVSGLPGVITLRCYCRPKAFCHRVILAQWLVLNAGVEYRGEA